MTDCAICGETFRIARSTQRYCTKQCYAESRKRRYQFRQDLDWHGNCMLCGNLYPLKRGARSRCQNPECLKRDQVLRVSAAKGAARVRARGGIVEQVNLRAVLARDRGICHVCDEPVRRIGERGPDLLTFDHVVPVSEGGSHTMENLAVCHDGCQSRK
ncbi:HNH endonuclease [Ruania alkalisoli]|uniref:HNH endonuclease n=1 Tax=Ruania alkalisoli TaxID=2779775 RepID=A0A7M1SY41_9MICO|nr:HNH endonuclease signature motif containing protein [Ruania alkalisoli]QOR71957.1 HNH endonuclease [Ruania alkalisoli]